VPISAERSSGERWDQKENVGENRETKTQDRLGGNREISMGVNRITHVEVLKEKSGKELEPVKKRSGGMGDLQSSIQEVWNDQIFGGEFEPGRCI